MTAELQRNYPAWDLDAQDQHRELVEQHAAIWQDGHENIQHNGQREQVVETDTDQIRNEGQEEREEEHPLTDRSD